MYKAIVVGVDASDRSRVAFEHALGLAQMAGARLHIVCAYAPLSDEELFERRRGLNPEAAQNIAPDHDVRPLISELFERARRDGVECERHRIEGAAAPALMDVALEVDADLLVVGNRGMTGARHVLGSVPNKISHHAPCSVLIVDTRT